MALTVAAELTVGAATGEGENTTLFVGGLSGQVTEQQLHSTLSLVGELASIKLLPSKGCAFVQFKDAAAAKAAITMLQKQVTASHLLLLQHLGWKAGDC